MSKQYEITLTDDQAESLKELAQEFKVSETDMIIQIIRSHVALRDLRKIRAKMVPHAEAMGIHTDEDVFEFLSREKK